MVRVSVMLDFYTGDLLAAALTPIDYINRYRDRQIPAGYVVAFIPDDWTVNR